MKLDKKDKQIIEKDKQIIIRGIIVAAIVNIFINKAMDIAVIIGIMYFIHKYLGNADKYDDTVKHNIVYIDKEKYYQGIKRIVPFLDVYLVIRILIILATNAYGFIGVEIMLVIEILKIYVEGLSRKYIKSINGEEIVRKRKLVNNKTLTATVLILFIGYSYTYFSNVKMDTDYIKSNKYEYSLTYAEGGKKIVEVKGKDDFHQRSEVSKENAEYMDKYIRDSKILTYMNILKDYSIIAMIFMFVLAFTQINFKDKRNNPVLVDIFLILAILFGMIWSNYSHDLEYNLTTYFHEYISNY